MSDSWGGGQRSGERGLGWEVEWGASGACVEETHVGNVDHAYLWGRQVNVKRLLPVGHQLWRDRTR